MPELDDVSSLILGNAPQQATGGVNANNLGNLRPAGQSTGFQQPTSREQSIQDIDNQLKIYGEKHGINTLRGVISRWAPPNENDTNAYINAVAQRTGLKPDQPINLSDPAVRHIISGPIIIQEKGLKNIIGGGQQAQQPQQIQQQDQGDDVSNLILGTQQPSQTKQKQYAPTDVIASKLLNKVSPISVNPKEVTEGSLGEKALGAGEAILSAAAPIVGVPLSAAAQLAYNITHGIRADNPNQEVAQKVQQALSYEPKTEAGKKYAEQIGQAFEASKLPPIMPEVAGIRIAEKPKTPKIATEQLKEQFFGKQEPNLENAQNLGAASVGAAETSLQSRIKAALNEASPQTREALKNVPLDKLATEENVKVIENHNKFNKFGLTPTEGQALESPSLMSDEYNARKQDPNLQARFEERDPKLIQAFNDIKEKVAPDVFENDPIRLASMPLDKLKNDYINEQLRIRSLYDKANRAVGESQSPIDVGALRENIINGLKEKQRTRYVPAALQADLDEVLQKGYMTAEEYENFRTDTATIARTNSDPMARQAASIIRDKLEQVPIKDEFAQYKPLYDEARKAVADLKAKEKIPAYKAAISDTRTEEQIESGVPHPAANSFIAKHYSANTPQVNIENMLNLIGRNSLEHQALNKLKIDEFKLNSGIKNDKGTVSQDSLNKQIYHQHGSNLPVMMGNEITKDLRDLADVANLSEPRKGVHSVNTSNSEVLREEHEAKKAAKEIAENIIAGGAEAYVNTHVPFGGTVARKVLGGFKAEKEAKKAAKAAAEESKRRLSSTAGVKLKDIGKKD